MKDTFTQFVRLGLLILALAGVLYWVDAAFIAPNRLPACVQADLPEGRVCFETLARHGLDKVLWVDARSENDIEVNPLQLSGNRVFPIRKCPRREDFDNMVFEASVRLSEAHERGELIVVFCTQDCNASDEIAAHLRSLNLFEAPIYTLEGGWEALKAAGRF